MVYYVFFLTEREKQTLMEFLSDLTIFFPRKSAEQTNSRLNEILFVLWIYPFYCCSVHQSTIFFALTNVQNRLLVNGNLFLTIPH